MPPYPVMGDIIGACKIPMGMGLAGYGYLLEEQLDAYTFVFGKQHKFLKDVYTQDLKKFEEDLRQLCKGTI